MSIAYPLHEACKTNAPLAEIRTLIANGEDVRIQDSYGRTPLHYACMNSNTEVSVFKLLLESGSHLICPDRDGNTPLQILCQKPRPAKHLVEFLVTDDEEKTQQGLLFPILHDACREPQPSLQVIECLVECGAKLDQLSWYGNTPLHCACGNPEASVEIIDFLIRDNADVHKINKNGETPLHLACAKTAPVPVVELLLKYGANVHARDIRRNTPLYLACETYEISIPTIELLVKNGADVNCQNIFGESPLHCACIRSCLSIPLIKTLLALGANVNQLDYNGCVPLRYLYTVWYSSVDIRPDAIRLLLDHGTNVLVVFFRSTLFTTVYTQMMQEKILVGILALKKRIPDDLIGVVMHEVDRIEHLERLDGMVDRFA